VYLSDAGAIRFGTRDNLLALHRDAEITQGTCKVMLRTLLAHVAIGADVRLASDDERGRRYPDARGLPFFCRQHVQAGPKS